MSKITKEFVLKKLGVVREDDLGVLVPFVPLLDDLRQPGVQRAVVADGSMQEDGVIRIVVSLLVGRQISENPAPCGVEAAIQTPA
jgi:hypothetical protein